MTSTLKAALISVCAATLAACANDPSIVNQVTTGMTTQQVVQVMGNPTSTAVNTEGFRCLEYKYAKTQTMVMTLRDRVIATSTGVTSLCGIEMHEMNFWAPTQYRPGGKYFKFLKQ